MPVDFADFEQFKALAATVTDCGEFSELDSREEVLAYLIAVSRAEGWPEADMVELAATVMSRDELRHARDVLKTLGYHAVARKLTEMARKAKR